MQIYSKQLSFFLQNNLAETKLVLLYGPEDAIVYANIKMVMDRAAELYPDAEKVKLAYTEIKDSPVKLIEEMRSMSLFTSQKIIIIEHCSAGCSKDLLKVLQGEISVELIIFIAGDLGKSSALRQAFEKLDQGMAVACYKPDLAGLQQHIKITMAHLGLQYESGVVEVLVNIMPPNPLLIEQELYKLFLYKDGEMVTIGDIAKLYENTSELSLDDLCLAIINHDAKGMVRALARVEYHDANFMLVIRTLLNFCMRLLAAKEKMTKGLNAQQAVGQLQPAVFFKQRDNLIAAARTWSKDEAHALLKQVVTLEKECKSGILPPELLLSHKLLAWAQG